TYLCYADNLSIQWTPENAPIPVSPYTFTWGGAAPPTPVAPAVAPVPGGVKIEWKDTATAWNTAISSGKPMFVYFSAPNVLAVNKLDQLFASDAQAQTFIQGYIPTKIDVNQLAGGDLARKFQIFKVPTILLMDSKGHETGRAIFSMADNWDTFTKKLIK
ncbi:MAG TPA: thioredoxin family protein, partial [Candidatus Sumerlaeota bacterium]|nr:thioredoxin family protein [Candidatus Sumerlaeota bacterium]